MEHGARSNGRKLVYVADKNQPGAVGNRPQKRVLSGTSTMEVSSTTRRPQASGLDSFRVKRPVPGRSPAGGGLSAFPSQLSRRAASQPVQLGRTAGTSHP